MKIRTTATLAAIGLVLLLLVLQDPAEKPSGAEDVLLPSPPENITAIEIQRAGETIELARQGTQWTIQHPIRAIADNDRIQALLRTLATSRPLRKLPLGEKSLQNFSLAPPLATLLFRAGDTTFPRIHLGRHTPLGQNAYLRIEGEPEALLVSADVPFAANRGVEDLRSRQILHPTLSPSQIQIHRSGLPTLVLSKTDREWNLQKPFTARADGRVVQQLLAAARTLKASSFFDDASAADLATYGLTPARIVLEFADAPNSIVTRLTIGDANLRAQNSEVWVRVDQQPTLYSVAKADLRALNLIPDTLRDKRLTEFGKDDITSISLARPNHPEVRLNRVNNRWMVQDIPAEEAVVARYIEDIIHLRGEQTLSTAGGEVHFGLSQPELILTLSGQQNRRVERILIGSRTGTRAVTREGTGLVYSLAPHRQVQLEKTRADFAQTNAAKN